MVFFFQCIYSFGTLRDCFMVTFEGFYQEVKPISLEVPLSTYIQEATTSFLKFVSSCNSDYLVKTEIRQFSCVFCSCSERDILLAFLSVMLVVPVLPENAGLTFEAAVVVPEESVSIIPQLYWTPWVRVTIWISSPMISNCLSLSMERHYSIWLWTTVRSSIFISLEE